MYGHDSDDCDVTLFTSSARLSEHPLRRKCYVSSISDMPLVRNVSTALHHVTV